MCNHTKYTEDKRPRKIGFWIISTPGPDTKQKQKKMAALGRGVSMFSLITDGVLEPGEDVLTFDYLVKAHNYMSVINNYYSVSSLL